MGALAWFIKTTKVTPFESVKVFRKDPFLALYFSPSSSMMFLLLCLLPSAALFTLTIWPFGLPPLGPCCGGDHTKSSDSTEAFVWVLMFSYQSRKCEASFLSVNLHQAHLQLNLVLFNSRLRFNPTPTFLMVTFGRALSFSKHASSLKAKFFPRLKAFRCISASSWGPSKESLFLFCIKLFFGPFSRFTRMVSFPKRYQYYQIGTPPPGS